MLVYSDFSLNLFAKIYVFYKKNKKLIKKEDFPPSLPSSPPPSFLIPSIRLPAPPCLPIPSPFPLPFNAFLKIKLIFYKIKLMFYKIYVIF